MIPIPPHSVVRMDCDLCLSWCFCHLNISSRVEDHDTLCGRLQQNRDIIEALGITDPVTVRNWLYNSTAFVERLEESFQWVKRTPLRGGEMLTISSQFRDQLFDLDERIAGYHLSERLFPGHVAELLKTLRGLRIGTVEFQRWNEAVRTIADYCARADVDIVELQRATSAVSEMLWQRPGIKPPLPHGVTYQYLMVSSRPDVDGERHRPWENHHIVETIIPLLALAKERWLPRDPNLLVYWLRIAMLVTEQMRQQNGFSGLRGDYAQDHGDYVIILDPVQMLRQTVKESVVAGMTPELFLALHELS